MASDTSPALDAQARVLVVGAGQAAVATAEALRSAGFAGAITLLGDEPHGPYHRPPLSKAWLAGEMEATQLAIRAPELLAKKSIALRTGERVQSIDRAARRVLLASGESLAYDGLVLATGATPRALSLPGADAAGVLPLRSRDDASAIQARMAHCAAQGLPVVVVGGGFIGLEVAATARKKGLEVTVLEAAPRLLGRVLAPLLSDWYAALHRSHGVQLVLHARIAALQVQDGAIAGVQMEDGTLHRAGLLVVGIGVAANDALAAAAGLACERGIVVDGCGRTSDPRIVAAGDCTARRLGDGSLLRLESVQNANEQAKAAAAALLGQDKPFTATPWFWSDQYDKKLQMAGLSAGADRWALRGTLEAGSFSVYHFRGERLLAVDSVNASKDHLQARKLLDAAAAVQFEQVQDAGFDLSSLLPRPAAPAAA